MKRNKRAGFAVAATSVIAAGLGLTACSHAAPAISQCAVVTGHGFGSNTQNIVQVAHPGDYLEIGNGDLAWYYPCDARNFIISPPGQQGDIHIPVSVRTAPHGAEPGMPVNIWLGVYFAPNENTAAMKKFLPFCLKYGCASSSSQTDNSIQYSAHSSAPGWENMLTENFPFALSRATQEIISGFGPDLWTDTSQWPRLGEDIAAKLDAELAQETQTATPFFCGGASSQSACAQMTVVINGVVPADPEVGKLYNQQLAAENALAANNARQAAARELYGPYADYFLGLLDLAGQCATCTIYVGTPSSIPVGPAAVSNTSSQPSASASAPAAKK